MCRTNGNYIVQLQNYKLIYLANSQVIHKIWSRSTPGSLQLPNNETCVSCVNGSCEAGSSYRVSTANKRHVIMDYQISVICIGVFQDHSSYQITKRV